MSEDGFYSCFLFNFCCKRCNFYHNNNRYIYIYYYSKNQKHPYGIQTIKRLRLFVPALSLEQQPFGGTHGFEGWGNTGVAEATRMVEYAWKPD